MKLSVDIERILCQRSVVRSVTAISVVLLGVRECCSQLLLHCLSDISNAEVEGNVVVWGLIMHGEGFRCG
jgi:hypothetical protein